MDSGADYHISNYPRSAFTNYHPVSNQTLHGISGHTKIIGIGDLQIECVLEGCTKTYTVWDVAHVPDVSVNLLAVNVMQSRGVYFDR